MSFGGSSIEGAGFGASTAFLAMREGYPPSGRPVKYAYAKGWMGMQREVFQPDSGPAKRKFLGSHSSGGAMMSGQEVPPGVQSSGGVIPTRGRPPCPIRVPGHAGARLAYVRARGGAKKKPRSLRPEAWLARRLQGGLAPPLLLLSPRRSARCTSLHPHRSGSLAHHEASPP